MAVSTSHVVTIARAEADKMRAAVAGAAPDAQVHIPVRQFMRFARLIGYLCDLVPEPGRGPSGKAKFNREAGSFASESDAMQRARSLAQIESDLESAEAAYVDANVRFEEAERDRRAALVELNLHQSEIDDALVRLRTRSPEESFWRRSNGASDGVLLLRDEGSSEDETALIGSVRSAASDRA